MISEKSNPIRESRSIRRRQRITRIFIFVFSYPPESYVHYLNSATVQAAIGACVNYTEQAVAVAAAFNSTGDDGRLDGTTTDVLALVEQGVAVNTPVIHVAAVAHLGIGHNGIRRCGL